MTKQAKKIVDSGEVLQANPLPTTAKTEKPFYEGNPHYAHISLAADPKDVVAFLRKYGNDDAMAELKREHPNMAFAPQFTTKSITDKIAV